MGRGKEILAESGEENSMHVLSLQDLGAARNRILKAV
jgi:hypothetical protein